ncbi:hypothetical protein HPB51_029738 [Rhipicephalus microplus]|uniref:Uncharacterized protein n=1 Tax=Rhipicephalus microplus TaxID=6941 RepID=A0A9J6CTM2_RHIMP|nr:hypothetical protein HPB51_029738 [Rhipicephalus microplus]
MAKLRRPISLRSQQCCEKAVTLFIRHHVETAALVSETQHELHYILPLFELRKGSFEKLFSALESSLADLGVSSYGIKNTTLEEVFLKVAEEASRSDSENYDESPMKPKVISSNHGEGSTCAEEKQPLTEFGYSLAELSGSSGGDVDEASQWNGYTNSAIPLTYCAAASASATDMALGGRRLRQPDYWAPEPWIFSGKTDEDVDAWLKHYDRVSRYYDWNAPAKLVNVVFFLAGTASLW